MFFNLEWAYDRVNRTYKFEATRFSSLEQVKFNLFLNAAPVHYNITIKWVFLKKITDKDGGVWAIIQNGTSYFPEAALIKGQFSQDAIITVRTAPGDYQIRILNAEAKDKHGREMYSIGYPNVADAEVYYESPATVTEDGGTKESVPLWLWILLAIALFIIIVIAYYCIKKYKKRAAHAEEEK
eukprot:UN33286